MNAARIMFCITILLTSPIECFVARDLIINTLLERKHHGHDNENELTHKNNSLLTRVIVTFSLITATCLISFTTDCLGIVLEFNVRKQII